MPFVKLLFSWLCGRDLVISRSIKNEIDVGGIFYCGECWTLASLSSNIAANVI